MEMKHLRKIAGYTKIDRFKNGEIGKMTNQEPVIMEIRKKSLN